MLLNLFGDKVHGRVRSLSPILGKQIRSRTDKRMAQENWRSVSFNDHVRA